ncbi:MULTISPECIES: tRNA 2-thiocytidine biosynthesis TtcA family protein [Cetobacterium]|uniref:ATP-binding protein n=1 Tax=Candidatus Cetobacterium colombiensis TaxID=3073100 RepID=A0ABU4W8R3_9FUSO|nr:ATP-binding protein [Candidatus Cetobacterium colombiensis]MDX8335437.1 ATP-binding protein [Candidatus Cetobacterium colombiensis]
MLKLNSLEELNGYSFQSFIFEVQEDKVLINNLKDQIKIEILYSQNKKMKLIEKIYKQTGLKIALNKLEDKELLAFIQDKGFEKTLWSPIGKAMHDYNMIEEGDRIAIGISGGKDSLTVLNALVRIKKISGIKFEIFPIHIHPVEEGGKYQEIKEYCNKLGVELQVIETSIGESILTNEELKNPCFICARVRRGLLYKEMKKQNINKLILGHHKDDLIETFLLNVFYQGNMGVMKPAYYSEEYGLKVIRPLAYVEEKEIIRYAKKLSLPILHNDCPYETSENSKRLKVKKLIEDLSKDSPNIRSVMLNSIKDLFV